MKIACFVRSLEVGGVERQITGLAVQLKQAGHDVEIIKYIHKNFFEDYLKENDIHVTHIEKGGGALGLARRLAEHLRKSGTELVISFASSANVKACLAKFYYKDFKLVVSERNHIKTFLPHDWIRLALYSKSEWVISNSYAQYNHIISSFPSLEKKSSTIVNFVDIERFSPIIRKQSSAPLKIVVISRVCPRKNTKGLIRVAKDLKDNGLEFRLEWYGATQQSRYFLQCQKMISKYGLRQYFEIKEAVHDVKEVYDNCDIFCLPSFYEGTPNAVCEALACGLPVVCSNVSDNALYVRSGENGWLFNPADHKNMVSVFTEIITSGRDRFAQYGKISRSVAQERLTIDRFRKEYLELIERLSKSES